MQVKRKGNRIGTRVLVLLVLSALVLVYIVPVVTSRIR